MTRFVPTRLHGIIDLTTPPVLLAVPALLKLDRSSLAALAPRVAGVSALAYSLITDYETAPRRTLPMPVHLTLDAMSGAALAAAPWLSGDARRGTRYWLPHAAAGASEIALALVTRTVPDDRRRGLRARLGGVLSGLADLYLYRPGR
jgi:hypothetical protein